MNASFSGKLNSTSLAAFLNASKKQTHNLQGTVRKYNIMRIRNYNITKYRTRIFVFKVIVSWNLEIDAILQIIDHLRAPQISSNSSLQIIVRTVRPLEKVVHLFWELDCISKTFLTHCILDMYHYSTFLK